METVIGRLTSFAASVECITKSLEENADDNSINKSISTIDDVLMSPWMQSFKNRKTDYGTEKHFQLNFFAKQLEEVVVGLWNATVTRQCSKSLRDTTIASLRQVCLDLLSSPLCTYSNNSCDSLSKSHIYRRIMISTKCGKAWLEIGEFQKAEKVFSKALEDVKDMLGFISAKNNLETADGDLSLSDQEETYKLYKHQTSILCGLAEAAFGASDYDRSFSYLRELSNLSFLADDDSREKPRFGQEKERVCALAYNFGLRRNNEQALDDASQWLNFSFEFGKRTSGIDKTLMAQCLRLMAHVYCQIGGEEKLTKSLEAVEQANSYDCPPSGLHLKELELSRVKCCRSFAGVGK